MQTNVEIEYNGGRKVFTLKTVSYQKWRELQRIIMPKTVRESGQMEISSEAAAQFNEQLVVASLTEPIDLTQLDKLAFDKLQEKANEVNTLTPQMQKN